MTSEYDCCNCDLCNDKHELIDMKVLCKPCATKIHHAYQKLLEFVKKIPELHTVLNINELYDLGFEAKKLLREIGEIE